MAQAKHKVLLLVISAIVTAVLLGLGTAAGIWLERRSFQRHFREVWKAETLGRILEEGQREGLAQAYDDPQEALQNLDGYAWSIANVPTPFVGSGPRPGVQHNAIINSRQFRSRSEVEVPKPGDEWRIFLTGGSTAFGVGAPDQERTIGSYLERLLNEPSSVGGSQLAVRSADRHYRVYTLANASWASTHERILIENLLSEMQPDLVISLSGVNDVHWAELGRNVLWFRTYQEQLFWQLTDSVYRAYGHGGLVDVQLTSPQPAAPETVALRLEKNVRLASEALSMKGARYLFALQPTLYLSSKPLTPREEQRLQADKQPYFRECYAAIKSHLSEMGTSGADFADLSGVFDGLDTAEEIFLDSYHFGDRGNRIVAERLAEWVRRETAQNAEGAEKRAR